MRRRRLAALAAALAVSSALVLAFALEAGSAPASTPAVGATGHGGPIAVASSAAGGFVAGVCDPQPCSAGTDSSYTISTTDASPRPFGTAASPATVPTTININRPRNLSTSSPAPAVIVTCTPVSDAADWQAYAAVAGYVFVKYNSIVGPGMNLGCDYQAPAAAWKVAPSARAQLHDCGTQRRDWCDGIPGLVSTIHAIECRGAPPCENVDPSEVYVVGSSEAALFTEGAMCDTRSSRLIAGVQVLSDLLVSPARRNGARPPSPANALPPNCPALLGVGRHCHSDCVPVKPNRKLAIQWVWGSADAAFSGPATSCERTADCVGTGLYFKAFPDYWYWGDIALASGLIGHDALRCSRTPSSVVHGGYGGQVTTTTYTGCADPGAPCRLCRSTAAAIFPTPGPSGWDRRRAAPPARSASTAATASRIRRGMGVLERPPPVSGVWRRAHARLPLGVGRNFPGIADLRLPECRRDDDRGHGGLVVTGMAAILGTASSRSLRAG